MGQKYLLECQSCDGQIEVEPKNAGAQCNCSKCGNSTQAPTLREIKLLPLATLPNSEKEKAQVSKAKPSVASRWIFLAGMLTLIFAGIGTAVFFYQASQLEITMPEYKLSTEDAKRLDNMDINTVLNVWNFQKSKDLDNWAEHEIVANQRQHSGLTTGGMVCGGLTALGLLTMIGSMFIGRK